MLPASLVRFMDRNFILVSTVVMAAALAATIALQPREAEPNNVEAAKPAEHEREVTFASSPTEIPSKRHPPSPIDDRREDSLLVYVEHKYRYLLADVESAHVEELKRRLLEREGEVNMARRASTDARIGELLPPRELAYYESLKDSDLEQHHLDEYVGGINNVAPLDDRQQREILDAKLRQKQRYASALRDAGLDRESLSDSEREYAHARGAEALSNSFNEFLMEVAPSLTPEQLNLLRNYETTEFQRELERLQQRINAK